MKYTEEQTKKILGYIVKRANANEGYAESLSTEIVNGETKSVYDMRYGTYDDYARVKLVTNKSIDSWSLYELVKNYKHFKAYVVLNAWDISWEAETEDEVLDCLSAVVKAETGLSIADYLKKVEDVHKVSKKLTLQEKFFEEN